MRVLSYNILDGGEGRADPLAEVIEAQRADVVCLVEASDLAVVERIANRLKMDHVQAAGRTKGASALLTRYTIRDSANHALLRGGLSKSLLEATLIDPAGTEWGFGVVHLHAHARESDEAEREKELAVVLDVFAPHRAGKRAHLICGDFNANSPMQRIDIEKCKPSTRKEYAENGGDLPRRVVQTMLDGGYVDTAHAVRGDWAATHGTFSTQFPGQRVDYIFAHGVDRSRLKDAWIEYDRLAKYASDHFPVGAEIE
jgi:endonuclease/exonuclease/phosphatase family metal-dependent hydrolase